MITSIIQSFSKPWPNLPIPNYRRLFLPVLLCVCLVLPQTKEITLSLLSDAFWQVSVFVAATLAVYHLFGEHLLKNKVFTNNSLSSIKEISVASLMGMLPGCGGAIIVITQYVSGRMSFGAVTAVLTATMGDAAFLLLAAEPVTGVALLCSCWGIGIISGLTVNKIHGANFLRSSVSQVIGSCSCKDTHETVPRRLKVQGVIWQWLMLPGAVIGFLVAAQIDVSSLMGIPEFVLQATGAIVALVCIFLWAGTKEITNFESLVAEDKKAKQNKAFQKVALDTNFITSWVVVAFLCFELLMFFGGFDLAGFFRSYEVFTPLIAVLVGMIPGCGPQILTTSLYISGAIPLSAQIGNAISNDGDALFPAIALSPKVALVATLYSSVPALLAAYSYYWLFE